MWIFVINTILGVKLATKCKLDVLYADISKMTFLNRENDKCFFQDCLHY